MSTARLLALLASDTKIQDLAIRIPYDGLDANVESPLVCDDPSLTRQSEADSTDLNIIMKRYGWNEELVKQTFPATTGFYGDVTHVPSYEEAANRIAFATQYFETLPLDLRTKFNNQPAAFLDYLADPANTDEAAELGLIPKMEAPAAPATPPPTPAAPPAPPTRSGTAPQV